MPEQQSSLQECVARQRGELKQMLEAPLRSAAEACRAVWGDRARLDAALAAAFPALPYCRYLYALDTRGIQISDNVGGEGCVVGDFGRDRSHRPYMRGSLPSS